MHTSAMKKSHLLLMRKNNAFYSLKIPKKLTGWLKSMRRKVGFIAVFADSTRSEALPKEASIHRAEMTAIKVALKEIYK